MWIALTVVHFLVTNHHVFDNTDKLCSPLWEIKGTSPISQKSRDCSQLYIYHIQSRHCSQLSYIYTYIYTHTYTYIYIYIYNIEAVEDCKSESSHFDSTPKSQFDPAVNSWMLTPPGARPFTSPISDRPWDSSGVCIVSTVCTWYIPTYPYFQWLLGRRTDALYTRRVCFTADRNSEMRHDRNTLDSTNCWNSLLNYWRGRHILYP